MNPPSVGYTPAHGNGSGPWGGLMYCGYSCDTLTPLGGANTPDEIVYYFQNATSGTLLYHQTQYACWVNETLNVSAGGNCCILPPNNNPCPTVTATSSQINVTCNGGSDGSATVVPSGGTSFTYSWSPSGGSNATATGLSAGNYTCTITNECGNSTTQTFSITETVSYQLNATVIQPTCGNNNGCIYFDPSPAGTYFYDWPFPTIMIVDSICDLAPGSYDITINSVDGCPIDTTIILANSNSIIIDANPELSTINLGDTVALNVTGPSRLFEDYTSNRAAIRLATGKTNFVLFNQLGAPLETTSTTIDGTSFSDPDDVFTDGFGFNRQKLAIKNTTVAGTYTLQFVVDNLVREVKIIINNPQPKVFVLSGLELVDNDDADVLKNNSVPAMSRSTVLTNLVQYAAGSNTFKYRTSGTGFNQIQTFDADGILPGTANYVPSALDTFVAPVAGVYTVRLPVRQDVGRNFLKAQIGVVDIQKGEYDYSITKKYPDGRVEVYTDKVKVTTVDDNQLAVFDSGNAKFLNNWKVFETNVVVKRSRSRMLQLFETTF
jgi:hypothetical protein